MFNKLLHLLRLPNFTYFAETNEVFSLLKYVLNNKGKNIHNLIFILKMSDNTQFQ